MIKKKIKWGILIQALRNAVKQQALPSVSRVAYESPSPFRILVSTVISLRTKDAVTIQASSRLLEKAPNPQKLVRLTEEEIQSLIYPAGFYKNKAKHLKKIAQILIEKYDSHVPKNQADLLSLPGVGRKTANLVLNLGYGIAAICVDTHVHRISNRIGWVNTKIPEQTEQALMNVLPKKYWIEINEILVKFGQKVCTPVSPYCSSCTIRKDCRQVGVGRFR